MPVSLPQTSHAKPLCSDSAYTTSDLQSDSIHSGPLREKSIAKVDAPHITLGPRVNKAKTNASSRNRTDDLRIPIYFYECDALPPITNCRVSNRAWKISKIQMYVLSYGGWTLKLLIGVYDDIASQGEASFQPESKIAQSASIYNPH